MDELDISKPADLARILSNKKSRLFVEKVRGENVYVLANSRTEVGTGFGISPEAVRELEKSGLLLEPTGCACLGWQEIPFNFGEWERRGEIARDVLDSFRRGPDKVAA